jgi:hypothetical protein
MTDQNNKADKPKKDSKSTEFSTKQTIGVLGGIVVLLAILFIGVSQTKPAGARLITGEEKPAEALYMEEASPIDYEDAILKEYEAGTLLELEGKVHKIFEEPLKGAQSILFNMEEETVSGESTGSIKQVILTLVSEPLDIKELQSAHVYGRYIGTLEYENTIGAREIVPAIQVDYIDLM